MNTIKDGTKIAYDKIGQGPAVILVSGAYGYRRFPALVQLAELLSEQFTVYNYDRRAGRDARIDEQRSKGAFIRFLCSIYKLDCRLLRLCSKILGSG